MPEIQRDGSSTGIHVELTRREAQGLRMACRWGCPQDPTPPEIQSAVRKLAAAEAKYEEAHRVDQWSGSVVEVPCADCGGTGDVVVNPSWPSGTEPYCEKCPTCGGSGRAADDA